MTILAEMLKGHDAIAGVKLVKSCWTKSGEKKPFDVWEHEVIEKKKK